MVTYIEMSMCIEDKHFKSLIQDNPVIFLVLEMHIELQNNWTGAQIFPLYLKP